MKAYILQDGSAIFPEHVHSGGAYSSMITLVGDDHEQLARVAAAFPQTFVDGPLAGRQKKIGQLQTDPEVRRGWISVHYPCRPEHDNCSLCQMCGELVPIFAPFLTEADEVTVGNPSTWSHFAYELHADVELKRWGTIIRIILEGMESRGLTNYGQMCVKGPWDRQGPRFCGIQIGPCGHKTVYFGETAVQIEDRQAFIDTTAQWIHNRYSPWKVLTDWGVYTERDVVNIIVGAPGKTRTLGRVLKRLLGRW